MDIHKYKFGMYNKKYANSYDRIFKKKAKKTKARRKVKKNDIQRH